MCAMNKRLSVYCILQHLGVLVYLVADFQDNILI